MVQATAVSAMQASLAQAGDGQIARVVAMVDSLRQRGDADALLQPLRARLAHIKPARPLAFRRLLFTPADPLIVPTGRWQRGGPNVPRAALIPFAAAIEARLPAGLLAIEAPDRSPETLAMVGGPLWPAAAEALAGTAIPADWTDVTGLGAADHAPVASALAAALRCAPAILALAAQPGQPGDKTLAAILKLAQPYGTHGVAAVTAILLARLPHHGRVMAAVAAVCGGGATEVAVKAAEHAIDLMEASVGDTEGCDAAAVAREAMRAATLLESLAAGIGSHPVCRGRMEALRKQAEAACRKQFDLTIARDLRPALDAAAVPGQGDPALAEHCARTLRRLEAAGQKLGAGPHYAATLKTALAIPAETARSGTGDIDQIRLVEILFGPEQAMALLSKHRKTGSQG